MNLGQVSTWYRQRRSTSEETDRLDHHPGARSLRDYIAHILPAYQFAPHLDRIIEMLEEMDAGVIDRGMITLPPRHGKTWTCSHMFPGWWLGRHPDQEFIHAGHTLEFARNKYGRRVRNIVGSAAYHEVFPDVGLSRDSAAANLWHTTSEGVYVAAGVNSAISGRGGDFVLIDDYCRKAESADSEVEREKAWDWYTTDLHGRLHPDAKVLIVSTRWHEDDLAGRLLKRAEEDEDADQWTVLHMPALSDDGKALWPTIRRKDGTLKARFDETWARKKMANVQPRVWEALYQGRPRPAQGLYFKEGWFQKAPMPEQHDMRCYGLSDLARSQSKGDYTVHMMLGVDRIGRPWVLDRWREKVTPEKWIGPLVDMVERWKPSLWVQEAGPIWSMSEPFITQELHRRKCWVAMEALPSVQDKEIRATSIQGYIAAHGLWMDPGAPFAAELIIELLGFPTATHDDDADCLSLAGRLGDRLVGPRAEDKPKPPPGFISFEDLRRGTGYGARPTRLG